MRKWQDSNRARAIGRWILTLVVAVRVGKIRSLEFSRCGILNGGAKLTGLLVSSPWLFLKRFKYDIVKAYRYIAFLTGGSKAPNRQLARQQFIQNDSKRIKIRPMINVIGAFNLFRSHVVHGTQNLPRCRQREIVNGRIEEFRQTKIRDLNLARFVDQNIFRFDVAVDYTFFVSILKRIANLGDHIKRLIGIKTTTDCISKIHSIHVFHDEVVKIVDFAKIEDSNDVCMLKFAQCFGFPRKPLCKRRVLL